MNLKLTNEVRSSVNLLHNAPVSSVKEERQRTGRLIALLVGICLLMLAIYHAWVRRIPVVASLVVPVLIMFVYVGWVLYTASRDKKRLLAAQAALNAVITENPDADGRHSEMSQSNIEISVISSKESSKVSTPDGSMHNGLSEITPALRKGHRKPEEKSVCFVKPIILINDKLPEDLDLDQKWSHIAEALSVNERLKVLQPRRKFKRKFCRSRRHAVFKRSYSIG
ncbi:uncharacterized protein LOC112043730 [Bicyclus anynana]|uniref:Uncharacterized protein LOC112043730 isoform X1 n=1 Tax=Bicyclus anynana TaxID=110368 RepID=A0A1C9EGM7_BICAN|nr:uncharacterized protein LOC112043730 [Bicyclus anynana]AON96642.1 hypothetical protein [Bicyclus anynana]